MKRSARKSGDRVTRSSRMAGVVAAIMAMLPAGHAVAQDVATQTFRDWRLYQTGQACTLATQIASRSTGVPVIEVILRRRGDGEPGAMIGVRVPNGASIRDQIAYVHPEVPNEAVGLQWQSCTPQMCLAAGELTDAGLDRLKRGRFIVVGFRPLAGARMLNVDVPLFGVTRGWTALESCGR